MKFRFIIAFIILLICSQKAIAQKSFPLNLIVDKEWNLTYPTVRVINQGWIVGDSTITVFYESKKDGKRATSKSKYYISSTKDTKFDTTKVGVNKVGQYIIIGIERTVPSSRHKLCIPKIYEIENMTPTTLIVKASNGERFTFSTK